jgi:hypothetical protein
VNRVSRGIRVGIRVDRVHGLHGFYGSMIWVCKAGSNVAGDIACKVVTRMAAHVSMYSLSRGADEYKEA